MSSLFRDRGVQVGLALSGILLTFALLGYSALFAFATQQVLQLDLRHVAPLTGVEYYGAERSADGGSRPVLVRRVLDIRNVASSVAESHHCDRVSAAEFEASTLPDLIVASEDRRFYRHSGVDFVATLPRLLHGKGASTITMQLARSTALQTLAWPLLRKPYEWALAAALEQNLSKDLILLDYANSIYVGKTKDGSGRSINMDGVKTAAYHLFGRDDLRALSLAEAATIVALFTSPNGLLGAATTGNLQPVLKARNIVLRKLEVANPEKYQQIANRASSEPVILGTMQGDMDSRNPSESYFFDSLARIDGAEKPRRNSRLQTTLDPVLQKFAAEALREVLASESAIKGVDLNGALIALDPQSGAVRALVGGVDRSKSELNRAHAKYSPGSTFKPFLYADAFDHGNQGGVPFTAAFRIDLSEGSVNGWTPADHIAGVILPRTGLSASSNKAALVVGKMIGIERGCELERLAFGSSAECSAQMLLGGGENNGVSVLAVAEAYAAFANGGSRIAARFIEGEEVKRQRLFSAEAAFVTTQLLRSTIGDSPAVQATIGNGKRLAGLPPGAELAGKTGSTDTTLWVAVIHPRLIVVIVAATDDNRKLDGLYGAAVAGAVWARFVRASLAAVPFYFRGHFARPETVQERNFNPDLSCITETGVAREYFLVERIPKHCK